MRVDAGLAWEAICLRKEHVVLTLRDADDVGHCASIEMPPTEALRLAHVLTGEMHGSCPDAWLVERLAGGEQLWLTLSATSRGMVRISRVELSNDIADQLARSLTAAAVECRPELTSVQHLRRTLLKPLRTMLRWGVLHTRPLTRQRQQWMNRVHRSMVALYRTLTDMDRALPLRSN
jgi:hypothetical protein